MQHVLSGDMKNVPCGPPPVYGMAQDQADHPEKQDAVHPLTPNSSGSLVFEDPPPYKEKEIPEESISGFNYLPPFILQPWRRFFSTCLSGRASVSLDNFMHNLSYYQINYAWMMIFLVIIALAVIDSDDFNFCILWSTITLVLVYLVNMSGYIPELFGRKLPLSEQLTAVLIFELLFFGLFPGSVPFIYFIVIFCGFVMVHACLTPINKAALGNCEIQHI